MTTRAHSETPAASQARAAVSSVEAADVPAGADGAELATVIRSTQRARFASVDTLRGAVLSLMIFVAPATGLAGHYPMLEHAEWNGITIGDLVFPSFLVTSGLSLSFLLRTPLKRATYARLARRLVLLVVLGLVYNAYGSTWLDLSELRFTGVLQMIGISSGCSAVVILSLRKWTGTDRVCLLMGTATVLVVAYGIGLGGSVCAPAGRCSGYIGIDTALLGASHVYRGGAAGFDPEGIMASLAAAAFVLFGFCAGTVLRRHGSINRRKTVVGIGALAAYCVTSGAALAVWMLPNKRLMTPAFVMFTTAIALAAFGVLYLLTDALTGDRSGGVQRSWNWLLVALGRNALLVYLLERFLYQTARLVDVGDQSLQSLLLNDLLPFGVPRAHLIYSAIILAIILCVTGSLHRQRAYWAL